MNKITCTVQCETCGQVEITADRFEGQFMNSLPTGGPCPKCGVRYAWKPEDQYLASFDPGPPTKINNEGNTGMDMNPQNIKKNPEINFQMQVSDDLEAKLPPWQYHGVGVDIVVDHDKKTFTLVVSWNQLMTEAADNHIEELIDFCATVTGRLREKCPEGWTVI